MNVLLKPVISEKTMRDATLGKYTFVVANNVNKHQISQSMKEIYKVDAEKVNIICTKSINKIVRGKFRAKTKSEKKAIITLKKGQKIEGFEVKE